MDKKFWENPSFHLYFMFCLVITFYSAWYLPVHPSDPAKPAPYICLLLKIKDRADFALSFKSNKGIWMCYMSSLCFILLNIFKRCLLTLKIEIYGSAANPANFLWLNTLEDDCLARPLLCKSSFSVVLFVGSLCGMQLLYIVYYFLVKSMGTAFFTRDRDSFHSINIWSFFSLNKSYNLKRLLEKGEKVTDIFVSPIPQSRANNLFQNIEIINKNACYLLSYVEMHANTKQSIK